MSAGRKYSKKKPDIKINHGTSIWEIVPLLLVVALVPLIVHIKVTYLNSVETLMLGYGNAQTDMFSYYKMVYFLIFAVASLVPLLFPHNHNLTDRSKRLYYIPFGVYTLFVFISSLASQYKPTSFFGFWGRYEGAFVLIGYIAVMFAAMNLFREETQIKPIFTAFFASAALISILGALQLIGIDYFKLNFILNLITPAALKGGGHMEATFGSGTLFSTLYNPNYVGSYMAMLIPIIIVFIIYYKKPVYRLILAALLVLVGINWIGCDSRAGIYGGIFAILVILVVFRKQILKHKVIVISAILVLFCGIAVANFATKGSIVNRVKRIVSFESKDSTSDNVKAMEKILLGLNDVKVETDNASLVTNKGTLRIAIAGNKLMITDENNKEILLNISGTAVGFSDKRFRNIRLDTKPQEGLVEVYYNDFDLAGIVFTKDGFQCKTNRWMTLRGDKKIETFGFKGFETFGSNRGYIWSRTLPLLKNAILLGYGPDTFPIIFPQYDYIGKLKYYGIGGIFVDKAHNMYLQTAMNSGVVSLLAMLAIFGVYFISSMKVYLKEKFNSLLSHAGLACFAAFCGYAVSGLFNDSVISVAPVFWVLLGLGIGINLQLQKRGIPASANNKAIDGNRAGDGKKQNGKAAR